MGKSRGREGGGGGRRVDKVVGDRTRLDVVHVGVEEGHELEAAGGAAFFAGAGAILCAVARGGHHKLVREGRESGAGDELDGPLGQEHALRYRPHLPRP